VLRFYAVYRAMVRAKVALLQRAQTRPDTDAYKEQTHNFLCSLGVAKQLTTEGAELLLITHGLSGSGKSTIASTLACSQGLIHIRSDLERKRLAGLSATGSSDSALNDGLYSQAKSDEVYTQLNKLARIAIDAGFSVILDATYLYQHKREQACALAQDLGLRFFIVYVNAPPDVLRQRIDVRRRKGDDASEATLAVLDQQQRSADPLTPADKQLTLEVDTTAQDAGRLAREQLKACL
jgi:hypothetical protein